MEVRTYGQAAKPANRANSSASTRREASLARREARSKSERNSRPKATRSALRTATKDGGERCWTDDPAEYPPADQAIWWEAWIRRTGDDAPEAFRAAARAQGLRTGSLEFTFIDRIVLTVFGTQAQMASVFADSDALAELRAAKTL